MNNVARFDRGNMRGDASLTDEGYIRANAVVTRTGIFLYQNQDGSIRRELRHPDDVWDAESISTMEMIPITNGHPPERLVSAQNSKRLSIGWTGETIKKDGDYVLANLLITDQEGVDAIKLHGRKELSLGYTVDLEDEKGVYNGDEYDARQRNIRYNHLAIVDKARAGSEARIALDSSDAIEFFEEINDGELAMAKRKIKIDNEEVMVEESTALYVERLVEDLKNLEDEKARVESEITMIKDKLEKTESERDSFKDQIVELDKGAAKMDSNSEEFKKAVAERLSLYKSAEEHLNESVVSKLDSMSNLEIKKSIINVCRKSVDLSGKSSVYVDAMFDTILDDSVSRRVNVDNVTYMSANADSSENTVESAQKKMMERQQNLHKGAK